jgi:hypothetical protein
MSGKPVSALESRHCADDKLGSPGLIPHPNILGQYDTGLANLFKQPFPGFLSPVK